MAMKKGCRNVSYQRKTSILADYRKTSDIPSIAKKQNLCESTIRKIIKKNVNLSQEIKDKMLSSMETGAGIVGNLAIEALKNKKLSNEKPKSLAYISSEMHKIISGERQPVQININMPVRRGDMINFLRKPVSVGNLDSVDSANIADNTITPVSEGSSNIETH